MKKLYIAKVEIDLVVVAENENEAETEALRFFRNENNPLIEAKEMDYLPDDWELNCIPYGKGDQIDLGRTIEGWINVGAAPVYKERLDEQTKFVRELRK